MPPGKSKPTPLRCILPRQNEAQAADLARTLALQDPVQPAPINTDVFQNADFGQLDNFSMSQGSMSQGFLYPPEFQNQMYSQIDEAMLSPNHVMGWEGSMQRGWGGFSGRNAAGFGQLSMDTSATQMHGMGNAAGTLRIASDAETHAGTCTDCLPGSSPHGDMDLVSPMSTGEQGPGPFQSPDGLTDCELHSFFLIPFLSFPLIPCLALPCH
jgi:hypothetical protein